MSEDPSQHKKLLIILIGLLGAIVLLSSISYAIDNGKTTKTTKVDKIKKPEPLKLIKFKKTRYAPLWVKQNKTHIQVKGARDSCGKSYNGYKRGGLVIFKNYCPFCKKWNVLKFHTGSYKRTKAVEGELSCKRCGADFCPCKKGNDKSYKVRKQLKRWK